MGLDIHVRTGVVWLPPDTSFNTSDMTVVAPDGQVMDTGVAYVSHPDFWRSGEGIPGNGTEGAVPYRYAHDRNVWRCAYSTYNRFRDALCHAVHGISVGRLWCRWEAAPVTDQAMAFADLLRFSDCEGSIGPVAAARLAESFADPNHREAYVRRARLQDLRESDPGLMWDALAKGCRDASDGGLLCLR